MHQCMHYYSFLCYDIKQTPVCHIISWNYMSRYAICHDYCGIPTRDAIVIATCMERAMLIVVHTLENK